MRKTFTIVSLLVALSLILTACGGGATPTQAPVVTEPPAATDHRLSHRRYRGPRQLKHRRPRGEEVTSDHRKLAH